MVGGFEGSIYGALEFFKSNATPELTEGLFWGYKCGKFLEKLYSKFKENDKASVMKEVPVKYLNFLSH